MRPEKIKELDAFWEKTDTLPVVAEHDTSIMGPGDEYCTFSRFCPEISFDVFGLFADHLHRYSDEIDIGIAHTRLEKEAYPKDWRWQWERISPLHYLKCPVYSQLISAPSMNTDDNVKRCHTAELLELKPGFMGIRLNLKALLTRLSEWWLSKQAK
jgi:hypothetical protein